MYRVAEKLSRSAPPRNLFATVACLAAVGLASACSLSTTLQPAQSEQAVVTGSVAEPVETEGIESTDAELIKTVVAHSDDQANNTSELAWSNPDTGNSGTIMAIDRFVGSHGQQCKKFQTTVDSFMGISLYDGETCEVKRGSWVLSWFTRRGADR